MGMDQDNSPPLRQGLGEMFFTFQAGQAVNAGSVQSRHEIDEKAIDKIIAKTGPDGSPTLCRGKMGQGKPQAPVQKGAVLPVEYKRQITARLKESQGGPEGQRLGEPAERVPDHQAAKILQQTFSRQVHKKTR